MAKIYQVIGDVAVVKAAGTEFYLYQGALLPDGADEGHIAHLVDVGLVREVDVPEAPLAELLFPAGDPAESWTLEQLKAYAEANSIDLGDAKLKADVFSKIKG